MFPEYFLVIACGVLALAYGWFTSRQVLAANAGTARMQEISGAVQVGARAYLNRQYRTIGDRRRGRADRARRQRSGMRVAIGYRDRRGAVGGGRLYRDERLGSRQCADRPGGAQAASTAGLAIAFKAAR